MREDGVVAQLDEFFRHVQNVNELPHSFDDTLIDKLIENITPNDSLTGYIFSMIDDELFDKNGAVMTKLVIRLANKFLLLHSAKWDVSQLIRLSSCLLRVPNQPGIWTDVLALLINIIKIETTEGRVEALIDYLKDVVDWSLQVLSEESLSLFVRNRIERLVIVLPEQFSQKYLDLMSGSLDRNLPPIIRESYHRLLTHLLQSFTDVDANLLQIFVDSARFNVTLTDASIVFLNAVLRRLSHEAALQVLLDSRWKQENQRINAIVLYIETINSLPDELLSILFKSPILKLEHFIRVFRVYDSKEIVRSVLSEWIPIVQKIFSHPRPPIDLLPDLVQLFASHFGLSIDEWKPILDLVLRNILNKTIVLESLISFYGLSQLVQTADLWKIVEEKVTRGLESNDWENRDSAVEIVMYTAKQERDTPFINHLDRIAKFVVEDRSPYVRASSIRCLHAHSHPLTRQLARGRLLGDSEPQPRLQAVHVFRMDSITFDDEMNFFVNNLSKLLGDADYEVRCEVVMVCDTWVRGCSSGEIREKIVHHLSQWVNDSEIGDQVKAALSLPAMSRKDPTIELLAEMIRALEIRDDETIDCY